MKRFTPLYFIIAIGIALFTSCNDDDSSDPPQVVGPVLDITELTSSSNGEMIIIGQGQILTFIIDARKGALDLETFAISVSGVNAVSPLPTSANGHTFPYDIENSEDELYIDTLTFINAGSNVGITNYTFSVSDDENNSASVSFEVMVETAENLLSDQIAFTWQRDGADPAVGLDQFGLEWTDNTTTSAIVAQDEATAMVMLTSDDWTTITTVEGLNEAIAAQSPIQEYTGISVTAENESYSDYIGLVYNGEPYILVIDQSTVDTAGQGTTITVQGRYKN
jgi:hypothetical protein